MGGLCGRVVLAGCVGGLCERAVGGLGVGGCVSSFVASPSVMCLWVWVWCGAFAMAQLYDRLIAKKRYSESDARIVMRQLLEAVLYIHRRVSVCECVSV